LVGLFKCRGVALRETEHLKKYECRMRASPTLEVQCGTTKLQKH